MFASLEVKVHVNCQYLPKQACLHTEACFSNWYNFPTPFRWAFRHKQGIKKVQNNVLIMTSTWTATLYIFHLFTYKRRGKSTWWCSPGPWLDWGSVLRRARSTGWCWSRSGQAAIEIQDDFSSIQRRNKLVLQTAEESQIGTYGEAPILLTKSNLCFGA